MTEQQFEPFEAFQCWRIVHLALHRLEKTFGMTGGQRMNIVDRHHNDWTEARQKDIPSLQAMVDQFDETQMYSSDQLVEFYLSALYLEPHWTLQYVLSGHDITKITDSLMTMTKERIYPLLQ